MNLWFIIILVAYFGLFFSLLHFYLYALKYQYETIVGSSNTFLGHKQWLVDNIDIYVSERCEGVGEKILIRPKCFKIHLSFDCSEICFSSVQFSCSVMSDSLWPHESQHARLPCPSPVPGVHPSSCASSRWCHPAISSSVVPFSSCPQSLQESGSFPMSELFVWGGQSIGVSVSALVLPMNTQDWSPLG